MDEIDLTFEEREKNYSKTDIINSYFKNNEKYQLPAKSKITKSWMREQTKSKLIKMYEDNKDFDKNFTIELKLGAGGFGTVYKAFRNIDKLPVAVKQIPRHKIHDWDTDINGETVPLEVVLLRKTSHLKGVISIIDYFERPDGFIIILERPNKVRDMFEYISKKEYIMEDQAREFFKQIVETIAACADLGIIHRDIKDENLLIDIETQEVKLIDFGCGTYLKDSPYTEFQVGTKVFSPPEWVLRNPYEGVTSSVWSLGILLYNMVCGDIPFISEHEILKGNLIFKNQDISDDLKNIITICLSRNPKDRPTLKELYEHSWFTCVESEYVISDVASDWSSVKPQESVDSISSCSSLTSIGDQEEQ